MEGKSILFQKYTQGKQNSCTVKTEGKTQFYKQVHCMYRKTRNLIQHNQISKKIFLSIHQNQCGPV